jgi:thioesterase domain-containing protein
MARQLTAAGERVNLLALLDTDFPRFASTPIVRALARVGAFRRAVYPALRRILSHTSALAGVGLSAYWTGVVRRAGAAPGRKQRDDGIAEDRPAPSDDPLTAAINRVVDANYRAMANYVPRPYDGVVTYFRAQESEYAIDRRGLWSRVARTLVVHDVPGGHYTMRRVPHVAALGAALRSALLSAAPGARTEPTPFV